MYIAYIFIFTYIIYIIYLQLHYFFPIHRLQIKMADPRVRYGPG